MPISARSPTKIEQTCAVCSSVNTLTIADLKRGVDLPMGLDPDVARLPACSTCSSTESLRLDRATWTPAQKASLAGRRRAAALWLVRKLNVLDKWTSPALKAVRTTETNPPDMAPEPAGASLEPV